LASSSKRAARQGEGKFRRRPHPVRPQAPDATISIIQRAKTGSTSDGRGPRGVGPADDRWDKSCRRGLAGRDDVTRMFASGRRSVCRSPAVDQRARVVELGVDPRTTEGLNRIVPMGGRGVLGQWGMGPAVPSIARSRINAPAGPLTPRKLSRFEGHIERLAPGFFFFLSSTAGSTSGDSKCGGPITFDKQGGPDPAPRERGAAARCRGVFGRGRVRLWLSSELADKLLESGRRAAALPREGRLPNPLCRIDQGGRRIGSSPGRQRTPRKRPRSSNEFVGSHDILSNRSPVGWAGTSARAGGLGAVAAGRKQNQKVRR